MYLLSIFNSRNVILPEFKKHLVVANKTFYKLRSPLKSHIIHDKVIAVQDSYSTCFNLCCWDLNPDLEGKKNMLGTFGNISLEKCILRNSGKWNVARRSNIKLYKIFSKPGVAKLNHLNWVTDIIHMNDGYTLKQIFDPL